MKKIRHKAEKVPYRQLFEAIKRSMRDCKRCGNKSKLLCSRCPSEAERNATLLSVMVLNTIAKEHGMELTDFINTYHVDYVPITKEKDFQNIFKD